MNIEELLTDTFTAHEHVAPDGDRVLAAAQRRIDRKLSRPLAVGAGVVALTVAAATVVVLNRPDPGNTQAAGPTDEVLPAGPANVVPRPIADLTMPYSLDWLPAGQVDYLSRRINTGGSAADPDKPVYGGEYLLTVTANGKVLDVDVQEMKMAQPDEAAFKSGPGKHVTIDGRPAVESSNPEGPGGYELYMAHPDGGSLYVGVSFEGGNTGQAQQLIDMGHQVAQHIRFPGTTTVTPSFGLGDLPSGTQMCTFSVSENRGPLSAGSNASGSKPDTSYTLGTCATGASIDINTRPKEDVSATPGQPVQGHKTSYSDERGYHTLWIHDAVDGAPIAVAGAVPLTDLYAVANGLVLP
ncbi:hypothetical protein [Actinophytocola sp.]|uniref:hypothetical protein n=1 Tax=Actinophytocola sp. TaxID=1872138 RepID=UPI00389A1DEC